MRKTLIRLAIVSILIVAIVVAWMSAGRQVSIVLDSFRTVETGSERIRSIRYDGSGTGGILQVNEVGLNLAPSVSGHPAPSIGSTKDGQLALASEGKVFAFGPLPKTADDNTDVLTTAPQTGDDAAISMRHSILSWPTPLDLNFMSGQSPSWKRFSYQRLTWKRSNGAKLEMLWRYEQYFYSSNGWTSGTMTREGVTGLIKIRIEL
ncbi:MAG: hypothetical protein QOG67_1373 [Verrucomicrobiota bacterium]